MVPLGLKILFVEDNDEIREALISLLEEEGYEVSAASSAEEALTRLGERPVHLVVTDYALPDATATWMVQEADRRGLLKGAQVLLVTAHPSPQRTEGMKVIRKPLDLDDFLRDVHTLLAPARAALERARQALGAGIEGVQAPARPHRVELILYFSSASPSSLKAVRIMQRLLQDYEPSHIRFSICDLLEDPDASEDDHIAFTPTLVKRHPGPRTWIVGDLQDLSMVTDLLSCAGVGKRR